MPPMGAGAGDGERLERDQGEAEIADRGEEPVDGGLVGRARPGQGRPVRPGRRGRGRRARPTSPARARPGRGPGPGRRSSRPSWTSACSGAAGRISTIEPAAQPPAGTSIPGWSARLISARSPSRAGPGQVASNGTVPGRGSRRTLPGRPTARPSAGPSFTMAMSARSAARDAAGSRTGASRHVDRARLRAAPRRRARGASRARRGAGRLRQEHPARRVARRSGRPRCVDGAGAARQRRRPLPGRLAAAADAGWPTARRRAAPRAPTQPFDPELALAASSPRSRRPADDPADGGAVLVLDDYHVISEPAIHRLVADLRRAAPAAGPAGDRHARRSAAARSPACARAASSSSCAPRTCGSPRPRPASCSARLRSSSTRRGGCAHRADGGMGGGASPRRGLAARAARPGRAGAAVRGVPPLRPRLRRRGGPCRADARDPGLPPAHRRSSTACAARSATRSPAAPDGQARLEELERANLLILPLDDERRWYRYHALFAEVLRARLGMVQPGRSRSCTRVRRRGTRRAATTTRRSPMPSAPDDLEGACRMVGGASLRGLNAGELGTVRRWLDALPDAAVRGDAQLSASYAWCLVLPGETAGVAARLADAERALERRAPATRRPSLDPDPARADPLAPGGP